MAPQNPAERDGRIALVNPERPDGSHEEAQVSGTLTMAGDCFGVEFAGHVHTVIWPQGTEVLGEPEPGVRLPSGDQFLLGGDVSLAGGYHEAGWPTVPDVPESCATPSLPW